VGENSTGQSGEITTGIDKLSLGALRWQRCQLENF